MLDDPLIDQLGIYVWAKDRHFKYLYCNEAIAELADLDSPQQIKNKIDEQLLWREHSALFRYGNCLALNGTPQINISKVIMHGKKKVNIVVNEKQLLNSSGNCIGTVGSYIDITGKQLIKETGHYSHEEKRLYLGEIFDNKYLTWREILVFKRLLLGYNARQIGEILQLSPKTIESYIDNIKLKFDCRSIREILAVAIQTGLTHVPQLVL